MELRLPKKALVTGGAGFLGSHLCRRLLADGYDVTALDNLFTGSRRNIADLFEESRFNFVQHDIVLPYWGQFDEIYNLACPASPVHYQRNPVETMKTSVLGLMNVLELAMKTKAKVLHASTSEIYGDPLVHPQDGRVISNFIMQALHDEDITLYGDGSQTRSFQYCDDLIEAMRRFMELPRDTVDAFCEKHRLGAPVVNTGNPGEYTIRELAEEVLRQLPESKSSLAFAPLPSDDPKRRKPDITLAKELLGWEPKVALGDGLARTIEYFRSADKLGF